MRQIAIPLVSRVAAALLCTAALAARPAVAHVDVPGLDVNGQCVGDADGNADVQINELITAVNNALNGCARLPITLTFKGMVGSDAFACGTTYSGIGTAASQFIPADFRFYVSNVRLVSAAGTEVALDLDQDGVWQYQNVALIDFETGPDDGCGDGNAAVNTTVKGSVPAGVYTGVKFDLGLPFDLNHGNQSTAPLPLNYTALWWSWQLGYRFVKIDTGDDKFRVHLGSTGCESDGPSHPPQSCSHLNLATVSLAGFNADHSVIVADLAALLADSNLDENQENTAPGCESNPDDQDCIPVFRNLGLTFPDGTPSATQKFFYLDSAGGGEGEHVEIKVAASADGGGALVAHPEFDVSQAIPLFFSDCFGGSGDDCTGGTRLFSAVNPGIEPIAEAAPDQSLFKLPDGVPVTLEVTGLDAGLVIHLGDVMLDAVGQTVLLGQTPDFHADLETDLTQPGGGAPSGTYTAAFKLTTSDAHYQSSEVVTLKFTPKLGTAAHD